MSDFSCTGIPEDEECKPMTTRPQKVELARLGILCLTLDVHRKSEETDKKAKQD